MPAGRPTKLTPEYLKILNDVVEDALYCTDEDLVFLANEKLPKKDRISVDTFRAYKAGNRQANNPLIDRFVTLVKKALFKEKKALMNELRPGANGWQAKAWILERKFAEWNLKQISEVKQDITTDNFKVVIENFKNAEQIKNIIEDLKNE